MGSAYGQLSLEERCSIAELRRAGRSVRQIAAALDRQPSTISRELKRNSSDGPRAGPYQPGYAQQQTAPGDGRVLASSATQPCARRCFPR